MSDTTKRGRRTPSDLLTTLKRQRSQLKAREAGLRVRVADVEAALKDVEAAITREQDRIATDAALEHSNTSLRVMRFVEQGIEPALIASTLRIPAARVAAIIDEATPRTSITRQDQPSAPPDALTAAERRNRSTAARRSWARRKRAENAAGE